MNLPLLCAYCGNPLEPQQIKCKKAYARKWFYFHIVKCKACDYYIRVDRLLYLYDLKKKEQERINAIEFIIDENDIFSDSL